MIDVQSRVRLFHDFTTIKQVENNMPIRMVMIHPYTYTYTDTYRYIGIGMNCGRTVGFKSCVYTAYTVHTQVCTSGNKKLQGPESKRVKQLRQFSLVEICQNSAFFALKYCIVLSRWISEIKCQFCPVAPCSNDRVVFASMLHVFIASVNTRKQHFWLTGDFILSPSSTASSWQSSLHHKEIWNALQG